MLKPPSSAAPIPGMTDTLDFVKNLWGSMNIPGAGMGGMPGMPGITGPALSTEDLDKRIADMKAVESWLNLNLTMLRGTIQAMEVQRGTLATLKSMGASMAEAMRQSGVSAEKMAAMPFSPFFGQASGTSGASAPSATPSAPPAAASARPAGGAGGGTAQPGTGAPQGSAPAGADAAAAAPGMPAALAWWNMLQDQFTQAVASAMTPAPGAAAPASPPPAASATSTPDGAAMGKPATAPQPEAGAAPEAGNGNGGSNGGGKARAGRPKADKA